MQNNFKYFDFNISNVVNIESERLFREAEDNFLYFNSPAKALKQLNKAIDLSPFHHKSLVMKGDIKFIKGKIDEALKLYTMANKINPNDSKILGAIATCYESKQNYTEALGYCEKAFHYIDENNTPIYSSLYELKISIMLKLKKYEQAKRFMKYSKNHLLTEDMNFLKSNCKKIINEKIEIKNRIKNSNLKAV